MPTPAAFPLLRPLPLSFRWLARALGVLILIGGGDQVTGEEDPRWSESHVAVFESLAARAKEVASHPYRPSPALPPGLAALDYDQYRQIAFEHEESIWKEQQLPYWLELFHRGYIYRDRVEVGLLPAGATALDQGQALKFDRTRFQYRGELAGIELPDDLGFAGVKIVGKFPTSEHPLEIASFLGASYFRAIGPGQFYGSSARGLAIDIGLPKAEEFPLFREIWIEQPASGAQSLILWALLDSPSVSGAYAFRLTPEQVTTVDVRARLFFRRAPQRLGVAPLTSMWMWGNGLPGPADDPRPRVHDSDNLLIQTADNRWIRRSLVRLDYPSLSQYDLPGIRGFGLMQAERDSQQYLDDEAKYAKRPSIWIEPHKPWPAGAVYLLELPAEHEGVDNIATWWTPKSEVVPDQPVDLDYRLTFGDRLPPEHQVLAVRRFAVDRSDKSSLTLKVNFQGAALKQAMAHESLEPQVNVQRGTAQDVEVRRVSDDSVEVSFELTPTGTEAMEVEVFLQSEEGLLSEQWRYLCPV